MKLNKKQTLTELCRIDHKTTGKISRETLRQIIESKYTLQYILKEM